MKRKAVTSCSPVAKFMVARLAGLGGPIEICQMPPSLVKIDMAAAKSRNLAKTSEYKNNTRGISVP